MANSSYSSRGSSPQRPARNRNTSSSTPPDQEHATPEKSQELPPEAGTGDNAPAIYQLPEPARRRGISEEDWLTLRNSLYPGALPESVVMVWDYCRARKLDPLKKPCHIVPMEVEVKRRHPETREVTKHKEWRDVVMPGIYEYRVTAMRTGLYMGHSEPQFGEDIDALGLKDVPYWCSMIFYRWNEKAGCRTEFPVKVFFEEICSTKWHPQLQGIRIANAKWTQSPIQMLTKCTEAAGLREAFPDELGGTHTIEEMEGKTIVDDERVVSTQTPRPQTHVDAAKEALRTRQQPAQAQGQAQSHPQAKQPDRAQEEKATPTQQTAQPARSGEPWEDEFAPDPTPQKVKAEDKAWPPVNEKERWVSTFLQSANRASAKEAWEAYVEMADAAGLSELDLDVESTYQFRIEQLGE